jgi:hypothetical protein
MVDAALKYAAATSGTSIGCWKMPGEPHTQENLPAKMPVKRRRVGNV